MIKISHEFPNYFYQNGFAKTHTDYDYILIHRYLENPSYRDYALSRIKEGAIVYLDNSLYELGSSFSGDAFADVIKELKPTYYVLPDTFDTYYENIDSSLTFFNSYHFNYSKPMVVIHGNNIHEIAEGFKTFRSELPEDSLFAIPFGSKAFSNKNYSDSISLNPFDIKYEPFRMALNRKKFIELYRALLSTRKIHLLGCKSLCEFDTWNRKDNSFVYSVDTSLPVAASLEGYSLEDNLTHSVHNGTCLSIPSHLYKPEYLIDKHFDDNFDNNFDLNLLENNIDFFRYITQNWSKIK